MKSKATFPLDVKTCRFVRLDDGGVFTCGAPDPTRIEIRAIDDRGALQVLAFEREALGRLSGILDTLAKAFPDAFPNSR